MEQRKGLAPVPAALLAAAMTAVGFACLYALGALPVNAGVNLAVAVLGVLMGVGAAAFHRGGDVRRKVCFGLLGMLFVLAFALGRRLDAAGGNTGWNALALAVLVAFCLAPCVGQAAMLCAQALENLGGKRFANSRRVFWAAFVLLVLLWLPTLLAFFPGIHSYDSFSQIPDHVRRSYTTHHPLLHTLALGWLYELGGLLGSHTLGLLMYTVAQMLLVAWAIAYALGYLARRGAPRGVVVALLMLFGLGLYYAMYAVSCTKDIPFAAFITVYIVQLHRALSDPDSLKQKGFWLGFAGMGALMCLMRNNAPYMLLVLLPFALIAMRKGMRTRLLAAVLATFVAYFGVSEGLQAATHAQEGLVNEMLCVPAQQLSRVYHLYGLEHETGYEIREWVPNAANYRPAIADPVKLHLKVGTTQELLGFVKFWAREFFHYPTEYVDAFLLNCKGYWDIGDVSFADDRSIVFQQFFQNLDARHTSYLPALKQLCAVLYHKNTHLCRQLPVVGLLTQPALYTWLSLFAFAWAACRRDRGVLIAAMCVLLYLATLMLGPLVGNHYSFYQMICAPLLVAMMCVHRRDGEDVQ